VQQASRLWNTEPEIASELLGHLVSARFLRRRANGSFVRAGDSLPRAAAPPHAEVA
jgi:hypothetical protein